MAVDVALVPQRVTEGVVVTARRVEEEVQEVPIPVSVLGGDRRRRRRRVQCQPAEGADSRPSSSIQRIRAIRRCKIRGLGAPFGLTNDGLEPGVGLYIDGVFYARPAAATVDFLDVERIEVLRGPQGTLFGKNTTAGAINVTTRKPSFTPENEFELNYGSYGFVQARASVTGPLTDKIAGRISFSGTQRDGLLVNTRTQDDVNDLNNLGVRGQLLICRPTRVYGRWPSTTPVSVRRATRRWSPASRRRCAVPRTGSDAQIAADLNYTPPSFNAFDRLTDVDTPMRSYQDLGGASLTLRSEVVVGPR